MIIIYIIYNFDVKITRRKSQRSHDLNEPVLTVKVKPTEQ